MTEEFVSLGAKIDSIDVRISHRIIQLFSEGLYSSPNKAIEELISNSFDAGAENVHVILSPNLTDPDATIVVIDDGQGMDVHALKEHWIIGRSSRRNNHPAGKGRKPIGKFGIGKLATYVLADKLTHICKSNGTYYATTMDYKAALPVQLRDDSIEQNGVYDDKHISLDIRELTELEAERLLEQWTTGYKPGYRALRLFGKNAVLSWTVAIMSKLKPMGQRITRSRLSWILRSAMPLRDDFHLFIDGDVIEPAKIDEPLIEKWIIGKDILDNTLRSPCPDDLTVTEDVNEQPDSIHRYGLSHPALGRITGYIELYKNDISSGKSSEMGRSHGFFVYVRGRMINTAVEDDGFGIQRNLLRHGTFSQFRMVVHIDGLDRDLRSSRESLMEGELYRLAQNFLHASFNLVRNRLVDFEKAQSPSSLLAARLSSVPGSVTRTPLFSLARLVIENKAHPIYMRIRGGLNDSDKQKLIDSIGARLNATDQAVAQNVELVPADSSSGIAIYDVENSKLLINTSHPFVAAFQDLYSKSSSSMPLELYAMTEILMEANLYSMDLDESKIRSILKLRDEILRTFVRSAIRRTPGMIAYALLEAKDDESRLELEMRAAFEAIGFDNVIRIGGSGKPDGTAEAFLPASEDGNLQRYKVGLEAKSGGKVSAKRLGVSGIARHMEDYQCHHHIVIGNGFETSTGEDAASVREIQELKRTSGRTITLMLIDDLARLVRLVPTKRIGLKKLRELFTTCITPEQSHEWIDAIESVSAPQLPYKEILETIWERAHSHPDSPIEYAAVQVELEHRKPPIGMKKSELIEHCKAMQIMAPGLVFARENTVEIRSRPELVIKDILDSIGESTDSQRNLSL